MSKREQGLPGAEEGLGQGFAQLGFPPWRPQEGPTGRSGPSARPGPGGRPGHGGHRLLLARHPAEAAPPPAGPPPGGPGRPPAPGASPRSGWVRADRGSRPLGQGPGHVLGVTTGVGWWACHWRRPPSSSRRKSVSASRYRAAPRSPGRRWPRPGPGRRPGPPGQGLSSGGRGQGLEPGLGSRLVHKVNGLVRQAPVGQVAHRQGHRRVKASG